MFCAEIVVPSAWEGSAQRPLVRKRVAVMRRLIHEYILNLNDYDGRNLDVHFRNL